LSYPRKSENAMPLDVFSPYLSCADIAVATRTASIAAVTAIVTICFRFMTGPFRSLPVPREHRQRLPRPPPLLGHAASPIPHRHDTAHDGAQRVRIAERPHRGPQRLGVVVQMVADAPERERDGVLRQRQEPVAQRDHRGQHVDPAAELGRLRDAGPRLAGRSQVEHRREEAGRVAGSPATHAAATAMAIAPAWPSMLAWVTFAARRACSAAVSSSPAK